MTKTLLRVGLGLVAVAVLAAVTLRLLGYESSSVFDDFYESIGHWLVELVVIIAGVFVGLQLHQRVNKANEARRPRDSKVGM